MRIFSVSEEQQLVQYCLSASALERQHHKPFDLYAKRLVLAHHCWKHWNFL